MLFSSFLDDSMATSCAEVVRAILRNHCDGSHSVDYVELFLDFEHAVPTDDEREVFDKCAALLLECQEVLNDARNYGKGATDEIRAALHNPLDSAAQEAAADTVNIYIGRIKKYYQLAQQLEQVVPNVLLELCSGQIPPEEQLDSKQALVTQLAKIVDFVLDFDAVKMCTPALQNDFSYYRRSMSRGELKASEIELANQISLFLASPTPLLSTLSSSAMGYVSDHPELPVKNTTDVFATIASVCRYMVMTAETSSRLSQATRIFCVRVMVGCVILYDHVDEHGAFVREAPIDLKGTVTAIRHHLQGEEGEALLNALRYTSKNFNHSSTPKSTKAILT